MCAHRRRERRHVAHLRLRLAVIAATTLEEVEEAARQTILAYLASINPYGFQDLVGRLLEARWLPRRPGQVSRRRFEANFGRGFADLMDTMNDVLPALLAGRYPATNPPEIGHRLVSEGVCP